MKDILSALKAIEPQGDFCTRLTAPIDDLQIKAGDLDTLKLPLTQVQAKALIKRAKPAQFGWKEQTLQDKKVRDTWEIPKNKIKIDQRRWNKTLHPLLKQIQMQLGMDETARITASLHNMLIYEAGQFFQAHQDSEKQDGMVASLVVVLPCKHAGGSLVIDHSGEKKRIQTSGAAKDKLTCIAFYADCHHEVKPLTSGYRVALTYNLLLDGATKKEVSPQKADAPDPLTSALGDHFSERVENAKTASQQEDVYRRTERAPKWVYLLDHQYTQKGLNWPLLKNDDRLRVKAIEEAAAKLDLEMHMALVDIQEVWDCEANYDDRYYRARRRKPRYYNAEDEDCINGEDYQLNELIDSGISLKHWVGKTSQSIDYSKLYITNSEICWTKATDEFDPFSSEYEGWMGNYGNTLERWYHRAAVVLWRKEDRYAMLCETDPKRGVKEITALAKRKSTRAEAQSIVQELLPYWHLTQRHYHTNSAWSKAVFSLALQIDAQLLAQSLIAPLGLSALSAKTAKAFAALESAYGPEWCIEIFSTWSKSKDAWHSAYVINCFGELIEQLASHLQEQSEVIDWLFNYQYATLKEKHAVEKERYNQAQLVQAGADRIAAFQDMLNGCIAANKHELNAQLITYLIDDEVLYTPLDLAQMLLRLDKNNQHDEKWGYPKLKTYINTRLNELLKQPQRKADDWSITTPVRCKCNDCSELSQYLQSSVMKTKIWPLAQERRGHIHEIIDGMGVPVAHKTKREGRPYKLVINKTEELFASEANLREKIKTCLAQLSISD